MPVTYVATLLIGSLAFGVVALGLERHLPPAANGLVPTPTAEVAEDLGATAALHAGAPAPPARS